MHASELGLNAAALPVSWSRWTKNRPNLLFVSEAQILDRMVSFILQSCSPPFHFCSFPGDLLLPEMKSGTLLLADPAELTSFQQGELNEWIGRSKGDLQIVSLTSPRLESLVANGGFHKALYYRLNVVRLEVDVHHQVAPLA